MTDQQTSSCADAVPGRPVAEMGYRFQDRTVLTLSRCFFASFAVPQSQFWVEAFEMSDVLFGVRSGPGVAAGVLRAVQAMRRARRSPFQFNSAKCGCCSGYVTPHEEAYLRVLRAVARGKLEDARAHAMILCELGEVEDLIDALNCLSDMIDTALPDAGVSVEFADPELQDR